MPHRPFTAPLFKTLLASFAKLSWVRSRGKSQNALLPPPQHEGDQAVEFGMFQGLVRSRARAVYGHWGWALSTLEPATELVLRQPSRLPLAWKGGLSALVALAIALVHARFR